jgi:hypothetical protein
MAPATKTKASPRPEATPPTTVEVHWHIEKLLGERFGSDLKLNLSRTDRVDSHAEREALVASLVAEVRGLLPSLEGSDSVNRIRMELSGISSEIQHSQDEYMKARYRRDTFDATVTDDPGAELQKLDAAMNGWAAKETQLKDRRVKLTHSLGQARAAADNEIVELVRDAINRRADEYRKRRDAAARELLRLAQHALDAAALGDSAWRELQDDSICQLILRKVTER